MVVYGIPKQPNQVRLDTTTSCNLHCLSCHRFTEYGIQRKGCMSLDTILLILKDLSTWKQPLNEIVPVNYGEFLLHPEWESILKHIELLLPRTIIVLPTNGVCLDNYKLCKLLRINTLKLINISLNAYFSSTYKQFCGGDLSSTVIIVENAIKTIKQERPDIEVWVSMVYSPDYQTEVERDEFITFWRRSVTTPILPAANCGRHCQPIENNIPCRSIFSDLVIGYDMKLSACCFDAGFTLDLDYYKGDAIAAWNNPKLAELRELHNRGRRAEYNACRSCSFA